MAWQDYIDEVQMLYVAYYQRPADPGGLRYWAQVIDNQGIQAAVNGFVNSPEAQSLYGGDITAVINAVYQAAFNRAPEPDGLTYWTNVYNNGWATLGTIVWEIVNGARNQDLITLQNKIESAMNFTNALDPDGDYLPPYQATYAGDADAAAGRAFLQDVTYDPATVKTVDAAKAYIQAHIADPGDPLYGTGQNINLTTGLDNILIPTPDTVDNIYGIAGNLESLVNTYNSYDIIQGNGHTILNLTLSPLLGFYSPAGPAKVTNVDKINLISGGSGTMYFDASNWTNVGSINLNAGVNGLYAEFGQLQVGTDLYVGNLVTGALGAYYTDHVYVGIYSDRQAQISYVDGTVNAYAQAGKDVTLLVSATADMTPITLGNISMIGALANSANIGIYNSQYFAGDITVGNVSVNGFNNISMHISSTGHGPLSDPSNITVGNVNVSVNPLGTLSAFIWNSGYNNVGDVKVGNVSIAMGYFATGSFGIYNSASNYLITDDVTVGDITVGNISVQLNNNASLTMTISNYAAASKGDATVGDITVGNISATVADSGNAYVYISNYAYVGTTGDATVGNVTVGNVTFNVGITATAYLYVSNSAIAYVGDATAGDVTIGNISATVADSGYARMYIDNSAYVGTTGDATVGNVKVGNVTFNVGTNAAASLTIYNYASVDDVGNATAGDITIGNISATVAKSGNAYVYISNYAYVETTGDATVGDITVGNVTFNVGKTAKAYLSVSNSAIAYVGNATAGDITIGNISATVADSGYARMYISNYAYVSATGDATVGNVTVGNVTFNVGARVAWLQGAYLTIYNYASVDDVGNATAGDITIGNISATVADSGYAYAYISNYAYVGSTGDATVGNVKVGNVTFNVGKNATASLYVYNSATAYVGNATAGDITVGNISATVADKGNAYAYIDNNVVAGTSSLPGGTGDATVGNVKVGNVTFNVGKTATANLYVSNSAVNYGIGTVTVGDITVGNISATLAKTNGNAQFYISNYALGNATGDVTVGNVTVGDVTFNVGKNAVASLTISNYAVASGFGNVTAGDITVGNITVTLSQSGALAKVNLYNFASAAIDNATVGDIKVGNITVSANNTAGTVSFFFIATNTASAGILGTASIGNITVGNITVSDVVVSSNNLATLTNWFITSTSGTITVGNVDYSGYKSSGATIDLSGFRGAPVVKGTINADIITDTTDTNAIYLGKVGAGPGDGQIDTVTFRQGNSGKTLTTCDKVYNFESGTDVLQIINVLGGLATVNSGGYFPNFAAFFLNANNSILGGTDIFYGYVVSDSFIAVDYNNDSVLDYVIQVVGVNIAGGDIMPV